MNRKIKKIREYRDDYRELKKQIKKHVYRTSRTDRKHLKKKNRFDERKGVNKLYQQCSDEKIMSARRR